MKKTPWTIQTLDTEHNGYDWPTFAIRDAQNHCLAVVGDVDRATADSNAANAKLMASAPDLLNALQRVIPWIGKLIADGGHQNAVAPHSCEGALALAEAAVKRATE